MTRIVDATLVTPWRALLPRTTAIALVLQWASAFVLADPVPWPTGTVAAQLADRTVILANVPAPKLMIPGKYDALAAAIAGPIGVGAAIGVEHAAGSPVHPSQGLFTDPSPKIGAELLPLLAGKYHLRVVSSDAAAPPRANAKALIKAYQNADLVVSVGTLNWGLLLAPFTIQRFRPAYVTIVQLVDVHAGKLVAQGKCQRGFEMNGKDAQPYDTFTSDGGQKLSDALNALGDLCLQEITAPLAAP